MMATVPHVTSGLGLRKFHADGFLLTRVHTIDVQLITNYSTRVRDWQQHERSAASVMAQQYSSATFLSVLFYSRNEKFRRAFQTCCYLNVLDVFIKPL